MAQQVTYTKLGLKPDFNKVEIINYAEGLIIEIKQFLPLEKKLEILSNIINNSVDDRGFYNTARIQFNIDMELIFAYTNIKFTEKQLENEMKLYDNFIASGLYQQIMEKIPKLDRNWFEYHVNASIQSIMKYRNSIYGILDAVKTDYSDLNLDAEKIRESLANDEGIISLKDIIDKMA